MFEILRAYLQQAFPVSDEDFTVIKSFFSEKTLKKSEFLLREGEVARHGSFVAQGCLRSYAVDSKGKEHIIQFAPENWWIGNLDSMRNQSPSAYFIDAIEDSHLLTIDGNSFHQLLEKVPPFAASFQAGIQKNTSAKDKRIISALSSTAEERYSDFLQTYHPIAQRVPQHMLASYLGITPETLSRIRKLQSKRK